MADLCPSVGVIAYTLRLCIILLTACHNVVNAAISTGTLTFTPPNPIPINPLTYQYYGFVEIVCNGTSNSAKLDDLFLTISDDEGVYAEEKLQDRTVADQKLEADKENFEGSIAQKTLKYSLKDPSCESNGLMVKCEAQASGDTGAFIDEKVIELKIIDGGVKMFPKSDPAVTRVVNQDMVLGCSAILAGEPAETDVEWEWAKKDEGESDFSRLESSLSKKIVTKAPVEGRCGGYNSSSGLPLSLAPHDNHRTYRCAYKNKKSKGEDANFDYKMSKSYVFGVIKSLDPGEKDEAKVVYSDASLYGMISGLLSFVSVSFLGMFYIYRKNRGGKKYDIVTALLQQEEEELAKIEERLGVVVPADRAPGAGAVAVAAEPAPIGEESGSVAVPEEASSVANDEASEGGTEDD